MNECENILGSVELRRSWGPHIDTSRRKITSDETATPPEPTNPECLKKIGQLRSNAIFNL